MTLARSLQKAGGQHKRLVGEDSLEPKNAIRGALYAAFFLGLHATVVAQPEVASVSEVASSRVASLAIPHSTEAVQIDGVLDDAIWRDALALPLTIET